MNEREGERSSKIQWSNTTRGKTKESTDKCSVESIVEERLAEKRREQ